MKPAFNTEDSGHYSRRSLLITAGGAVIGSSFLGCASTSLWRGPEGTWAGGERQIKPAGPGSQYIPTLRIAFVRRKGDYGMRWPGAVYDGQAALRKYCEQIDKAAKDLGLNINMRTVPIYSDTEADQWIAQSKVEKPDGLLVVLLDRQEHAWPTASKAVDSGIPTIVFAPIGTAFTTNTCKLADKTGIYICSTDDFSQVNYGMKMIKAGAKLREMRFIVIESDQRQDIEMRHFGTKLRCVPANVFLDEYNKTPVTEEVKNIAAEYIRHATSVAGATEQDVLNGVKSYVVARTIMEREEGDGITMDCLGALGHTPISLPCIAWSRMLDHGVPAACEADRGAALTHALVQFLFDRPGFQQDPVPETAKGCLIGAHCTCPTRLKGFSQPPEPYRIFHHHGMRDAVPIPTWRIGQRVTVADIIPSPKDDVPPSMYISSGQVVENISVPPSGGCVVSVMVKLDGVNDLLGYPGFHQLFFYGDYKKQLQDYCQLFSIKPMVI